MLSLYLQLEHFECGEHGRGIVYYRKILPFYITFQMKKYPVKRLKKYPDFTRTSKASFSESDTFFLVSYLHQYCIKPHLHLIWIQFSNIKPSVVYSRLKNLNQSTRVLQAKLYSAKLGAPLQIHESQYLTWD